MQTSHDAEDGKTVNAVHWLSVVFIQGSSLQQSSLPINLYDKIKGITYIRNLRDGGSNEFPFDILYAFLSVIALYGK